ncbi:gamma-glutamyl-gamma-aminobutyrate hydrolase family protein [Thalassorhabdomicrobium marinisediminis]|uniref:Gamma-glutamyl-gamma-aminobutyrate hydrolase n=1 Tax=Thalassorhabdomicrobium marinisediminis TaxID=2170577 RepID=A0A2T7FXZ3_9RHOB|nr:gamma-glutamyl-gamma-aminobutyrate hydrolase family protein [Thalassorhabdomicrobium marinisediminis]PVA07042.1 gamma-glutamyl-gamma-aminobutyrate hydrolase [Thalassorhabdomicrobium marinisediminis]
MRKPVIGIIGNRYIVNDDYPVHAAGMMDSEAIAHVAEAVPLIVPADPTLVDLDDLLETCDGFLLTGGRPNVHPEEYGHPPTEAHGAFDRARDGLTLPLVRRCVERGQPFFGICRGFQEVAVAMGCTLHPEIRDLDGRDNHRMPPDGTLEEKFAMRHIVTLTEGGKFHELMGTTEIMTNSLHGQGILDPSDNIVVEGHAPDGTPEAIYVRDAKGFTLSVQWHPEYQAGIDPVSKRLFGGLGDAARDWANGRQSFRRSA